MHRIHRISRTVLSSAQEVGQTLPKLPEASEWGLPHRTSPSHAAGAAAGGAAGEGVTVRDLDTLAILDTLRKGGMEETEARAVLKVVRDATALLDARMARDFVLDRRLVETRMEQESSHSLLRSELTTALTNGFEKLTREDSLLRNGMEKQRAEQQYSIEKLQAAQRLDMNLFQARIRDENIKQDERMSHMSGEHEKQIYEIKNQVEAARSDILKYTVGTIMSVTAAGLALARLII